MKNTAPTKYNGARFFFTSDLSDDELQALEQFLGKVVYILPPNREDTESVIIIYTIITGGIVVTGIFTALLLLTLMLHLTDNCSEQINAVSYTHLFFFISMIIPSQCAMICYKHFPNIHTNIANYIT